MRMRRASSAFFAALLLLLVPQTAGAATVQTLDMGKGVQVWYVEDHTLPIVAMTVTLPAGSAYDPQAKPGLASFAAAMLDEGAGPYSSKAYQLALSQRGIRLSAGADRDWMVVSLTTLKENARDAFHLLGVALSKPHFDPDAVSRVRAQILSSLAQDDEDPSTVAAKAFYERFFSNHPYGHSISGDPAGIAAISREDLRAFAQTHWVRGGIHIAVSGDIDPQTLKTLLASAFGALPIATPPQVPPVRHMGAPGVQIVPMPVPQPNIVFGLPALPRNDPDFIASYVANYVLGGGGFSSRLMNEVREKRGLTYGINTSVNTLKHAGFFAGTVATKAGSVPETIAVIRDTLANFAANGPTKKELADAQTYLTGSFPLAFTSNVGIAAQLNTFENVGLPASYVEKRNALIDAVTVDDVKRVAKRIIQPGRLTIVIAGNPNAPKEARAPLPGVEKPPGPAPRVKSHKPSMLPGKRPIRPKPVAGNPPKTVPHR